MQRQTWSAGRNSGQFLIREQYPEFTVNYAMQYWGQTSAAPAVIIKKRHDAQILFGQ